MRKIVVVALAILSLIIVYSGIKFGRTMYNFLHMETITIIAGELYLILGGGSNSGLILGEEKAVLIDTKMGKFSRRLYKFVNDKVGDRELIIINTHFHGDHIRGNHLFEASSTIAGDYSEEFWIESEGEKNLPSQWIKEKTTIDLSKEVVEILPIGKNHTRADLFIYLRNQQVLFTGDVFMHGMHAVIMSESDPDVIQWEKTLKDYGTNDLHIELVVPGHGPLGEKEDLLEYAQYFGDFRNEENTLISLKRKYLNWDALPFMANTYKTYRYFQNAQKDKISS